MVRTTATISLDSELKNKASKFLKEDGYKFSFFVQQALKNYIKHKEKSEETDEKEVEQDGIILEEEIK